MFSVISSIISSLTTTDLPFIKESLIPFIILQFVSIYFKIAPHFNMIKV